MGIPFMSTFNLTSWIKSQKKGPISKVLSPIKKPLIIAVALSFIGSIFTLVPLVGITHIAQIVLDDAHSISAVPVEDEIWWAVIICVGSVLIGMTLVSIGELVAHLADNRITQYLRLAVAQRLTQVPLGWFSNQTSGEVKQAMQDDIATLHSLTAHFYTSVTRAVSATLASGVYLLYLDWRMAIIVLLPFFGFFLFLRRAMKLSKMNIKEFATQLGEINSTAVEFVNGIPVIKTFDADSQGQTGFRRAVDDFAHTFINFTRPLVTSMAHAHAMISPVTILSISLIFGALFISQSWITPVGILPFALVAPGICAPILLLHTLLHDLDSATAAAQRVLALLETPLLDRHSIGQQQPHKNTEILFENVSYSYGENHQALSNISLNL